MSSFNYCINEAVKSKKISKTMADEILAAPDQAEIIRDIAETLTRERREKVVDAIRLSNAIEAADSHPEGLGAGLASLMGKDITGKANYANVDFLQKTYTNKFLAGWANGLERFRTTTFGLSQDKEGINNLIRALHGKAVDDADIMQIAKDYNVMMENIRLDFNAVGGSISKNEDWILPQKHDMTRVAKLSEDEWVDYIKPLLDRNKMLDDLGKPLDDAQFNEGLRYTYQTITTGGMNKAQGLSTPRGLGRKLSRKGSEKRFLYFKDGDSWISYQNKFGRGDIFTTITDHIQDKAGDIALMQVLGTNPKNMYEGLKNYAVRESQKRGKPLGGAKLQYYDNLYKVISGEVNGGQVTGIADTMQAWRNVEVASKLGGAALASFTDVATTAITANYNKMSATKVFMRQAQLLKEQAAGGGEEARNVLARMGFVFDTTLGRAHSLNRYTDTYGSGTTAKVAEVTLRASGLEAWTQAMQKGFSMEFAGMLSDSFKKSFDDLDFKEVLERYGITKEDWNAFRKTEVLDFKGAKFANVTLDKSMKFHRMILQEMEYATPTMDARTQAITTAGTQRGTGVGQAVRSIMQIKSFPITVAMNHWMRGMSQATMGGTISYLTTFFAASTMMGGLSVQSKELAKGRTPRNVDGEFLFDAFIMGGAGSLFADFLLADSEKYGQSLTESIAGVQASTASKLIKMTKGNIKDALKGEDTNILGDGLNFIKGLTPDTWYTQLFTDNMIEAFRKEVDPNRERTLNKMARQRQTEYGQGQWWQQGELTPEFVQD